MKSRFFFCAFCLGLAPVVIGQSVQFNSTNTVGMTCITSTMKQFPIGVTYGGYCVSNTFACITNMLVSQNLEGAAKLRQAKDKLLVWSYERSAYDAYWLNTSGVWVGSEALVEGQVIIPDPKDEIVGYGRGVWLLRIFPRASTNIYVYGQIPVGEVTTVLQGCNSNETSHATLISIPFSEPFSLNDTNVVNWASANPVSDQINLSVMDSSGTNQSYQAFKWDAKGWYYSKRNAMGIAKKYYDGVIPRGQAFWYERRSSDTTNVVWHLDKIGNK